MAQFNKKVQWFYNPKGDGFVGRDRSSDVWPFSLVQLDGYKSLKEGDDSGRKRPLTDQFTQPRT